MKDERFKELVKDGIYVKVNNEKEVMVVLKMCEKHEIDWFNEDMAIKFQTQPYPYFLHIYEAFWEDCPTISYLKYPNYKSKEHKIVDIKEFLPPKQEIHITRKDNETHAIFKEDGKVIKHTVARCHPDDKYDFKTGSNTAYSRLFLDDNDEVFKREYECNMSNLFLTTDMLEPYSTQPRQAKIGEYVVIVKDFENSVFKKGIIVKRTGVAEYEYINGDKYAEFTNSDGISTLLSPKDYVILEDYKPPLNCRFVVGNDVENLTAGKIYEVKDGVFKDDSNDEFPCLDLGDEPLRALDDLQEFIGKSGAGHYTDEVVEYIVLKD